MVNARAAAARGEYYDPLHPPDGRRRIGDCICPLWRSHSLADLFEEISTDVRLRVALLWPCLIEAFDFCFAATHDWKSRRRWRVWGTLADGWC
jgi:hypothetical protein